MAGDWIKMRMDLPEDPAVYRLARITGLERLSVVGRLYAFWSWADKHAVDGRVDGGSASDVDDIVSHCGFAEAMAKVGWLQIGDEFLAIPKHDRHNGESAKERSLKNARQARWREKKDDEPSTPPSTKASTREEKRREDIEEPRKARKSKLPDDFAPNETGTTKAATAGLNVERELAKFKDHHTAKGTTMLDWQAAWRTWVGNAIEFGRGGKPANDDPYGLKKAINQ